MDTTKITADFTAIFTHGADNKQEERKLLTTRATFVHDLAVEMADQQGAVAMIRNLCSDMLGIFILTTASDTESDEWKARKQSLLNECSQWRKACAKEGFTFGDWNRPKRAAVIEGTAKYEAEVVKAEPKASAGRTKGKAKAETVEPTPVEGSETQASIDITNLAAVLNVLIPIHTTAGLVEGLLQRCGLSDTQAGVLTVAMLDNHSAMLKRLADAACRDAAKGSKGKKAA